MTVTVSSPALVPGFLIFPTDIAFLNDFFSVISSVATTVLAMTLVLFHLFGGIATDALLLLLDPRAAHAVEERSW